MPMFSPNEGEILYYKGKIVEEREKILKEREKDIRKSLERFSERWNVDEGDFERYLLNVSRESGPISRSLKRFIHWVAGDEWYSEDLHRQDVAKKILEERYNTWPFQGFL